MPPPLPPQSDTTLISFCFFQQLFPQPWLPPGHLQRRKPKGRCKTTKPSRQLPLLHPGWTPPALPLCWNSSAPIIVRQALCNVSPLTHTLRRRQDSRARFHSSVCAVAGRRREATAGWLHAALAGAGCLAEECIHHSVPILLARAQDGVWEAALAAGRAWEGGRGGVTEGAWRSVHTGIGGAEATHATAAGQPSRPGALGVVDGIWEALRLQAQPRVLGIRCAALAAQAAV